MILQCTPEVFAKLSKLRTRFPWAVVDMDGVAVEVFNYRASAQGFAQVEQARTGSYYNAIDATGAIWEELTPTPSKLVLILSEAQAQAVYNTFKSLADVGVQSFDLRFNTAIVYVGVHGTVRIVGPNHPNDEHYSGLAEFARAYALK